MLGNTVITSFVISLFFLGVTTYVFAAEPSVSFDQPTIALEHSSNLIIEDTSIPTGTDTIEAQINSNNAPISITLDRVGTSDVFKSKFIKFTTGSNQDYPPELNVGMGDSITILYGGTSYTSSEIVSSDNTLSSSYNSVDTFRTAASRGCSSSYGGDADKDGICDKWDAPNAIITYPRGSTYSIPCVIGETYATNPLGDKVCPNNNVKDIYVEIDWMAGHKPNIESLKQVVAAFNDAPASPNEFRLHVILDEEVIPHINTISFPGSSSNPGFDHIKAKEFGTDVERADPDWNSKHHDAKAQVFYYYLWTHDQFGFEGSSGIAEEGGNDGGVTLGSFDGMVGNEDQQAGTFMHELGHNLAIDHGGAKTDEDNCKPNLLSVMSYSRQFSDLVSDRALDFSRDSVGTTADNTSLGMENALNNDNGVSNYPYDSDSLMVYGIGQGMTELYPVNQPQANWPSNWQDVRYIDDPNNAGTNVCPPPTPSDPAELDSVNQWELIDLSTKNSHWREGRSVDIQTNTISNPFNLETDKMNYISGETIKISGSTSLSPTFATLAITAPNGNIVSIDQVAVNSGSFDSSILVGGPLWQTTGDYTVRADIGSESVSLPFKIVDSLDDLATLPPDTFPLDDGEWCMSHNKALKLADKLNLDIKYAPICSNENSNENEMTVDNVREARYINVNNVLGIISKMSSTNDFGKPVYKTDLINDLDVIRQDVKNDNMFGVYDGYTSLKGSIENKVNDESEFKISLLKVVDRNIESTSHTVPEFETVAMLVLMISITSVILISRKSHFNGILFK